MLRKCWKVKYCFYCGLCETWCDRIVRIGMLGYVEQCFRGCSFQSIWTGSYLFLAEFLWDFNLEKLSEQLDPVFYCDLCQT